MKLPLNELAVFVAVADQGSFQKAAVARGVTRSAVSHAVKALETSLGVRLLNRNTRSLSLTEVGAKLHQRLAGAFGDVAAALEEVNRYRETPLGVVRLTAPRAIGPALMSGVLAKVIAHNPGLSIDLSLTDSLVDIVAEGYDAGVRFGDRVQKDMIAVRIEWPLEFAVVGAPTYFANRPPPQEPRDLRQHECIGYRFPSGMRFPWEFERDGQGQRVDITGPLVTDDQEMMIEAALGGVGLAFVFEHRVRPHLKNGALVRCLADWTPQFRGLSLYYPDRRFVSGGLRTIIAALRAHRKSSFLAP